jgi:predicted small lipoprotein YifL
MLRSLSCTLLVLLALTATGCGGKSGELPPKNVQAGETMTKEQAMERAMQGMPPEIQKKMAPQMQRMSGDKPPR